MQPQWDRDALLADPAFESLRSVLTLCPADRFPSPCDLTRLAQRRGVSNGAGAALSFVPAEGAPDLPYEERIYRNGEVPTRAGSVHDLFNALAWLAFPMTKAVLNRRHYAHMTEMQRFSGSRGTPRDVLTLFDESGVIVACADPDLADLLRDFQWKTLLWSRRAAVVRSMRFLVCGHAVHEKLLRPYMGLTGKALVIPVRDEFLCLPLERQLAEADAHVALHLSQRDALAATDTLAPLPVQGIPGWCAANECASFYDDASVFRPGRRHRARSAVYN